MPSEDAAPAARRRRRRDRHGRGLRGPLLPTKVLLGGREVRVPASQTRGERFDDLVLDAVEDLEQRWAKELEGVEFAVEDVAPGLDSWGSSRNCVMCEIGGSRKGALWALRSSSRTRGRCKRRLYKKNVMPISSASAPTTPPTMAPTGGDGDSGEAGALLLG